MHLAGCRIWLIAGLMMTRLFSIGRLNLPPPDGGGRRRACVLDLPAINMWWNEPVRMAMQNYK